MTKINIVVLDYSGVTATFYSDVELDVLTGDDELDAVEQWITDNTEHHLSNCSWMSSSEEITVINK